MYPLSGIPRDVEEHRIADINDLTENLKKIQGSRWWKLHEKMKPVISLCAKDGTDCEKVCTLVCCAQ